MEPLYLGWIKLYLGEENAFFKKINIFIIQSIDA